MPNPLRILALASLVACDPFSEETPTDTAPLAPEGVDQCTETYTVPGSFGILLDKEIAPHALTFGETQWLGAEGASNTLTPDPSYVHLGWPGRDTSTSISFAWMTDKGTLASQVQWGEGDALDTTTDGVSFTFGGTDTEGFRVHELKLCGRLKPNTTYSYRVGGEGHWSPTYQFTTPPAPGTFDTFTVAIAGDSRGAYEDWANIVSRMEAHNPDFYMFSGDMVEAGGNQVEWDGWWRATGDVFARKVFVPAHGNHEFLAMNYFAQFSLPNNEQWFSLNYGSLSLTALNDTVAEEAQMADDEVVFLREKLGTDTSPWKFVMHHRPIYSTCTRHGSDEVLRGDWAPVFEEVGVDMVIAGHNHIYERSVPIQAEQERPVVQGTTYLVSGGAGASLYQESEADWFNAVANPIEHYIIAEFSAEGVNATVYDRDDNVIDSFFLPAP